jgi:bifunctional UDP-N-acetylglucosamine pyrophosphorylase/glucosamine-1-phosphate N-acetyltransferase
MPESSQEILGVNTRVDLARAEAALRQAVRRTWMLSGVTMPDPASVYIDLDVELGQDTIVLPNTHISGRTRIGPRCIIGPNSMIDGSEIGEGCEILASVVEGATLDEAVHVGPFSHIRPGSQLESGVHIGNFAEVKKSRLGRGARSGHFSYLGDAEIGAHVNIGAGTVTCNYDGVRKHRTLIEDDAFIGSDSMLVAPVTIGARSTTGAGAVVTRDVPADSMAVGIPARLRPKRKGRS